MKLKELAPDLETRSSLKSGLLERVLSIKDKEVAELSHSELAFCLRQKIAVSELAPKAIALLEDNPFFEVEYYPGDLLSAVLSATGELGPDLRTRVFEVCCDFDAGLSTLNESVMPEVRSYLENPGT
ncbi:MAG: hypothetical protein JJ957_20040 [Pseudomonadales bacterium]|nr:hypothetical protein [Pseudomonadales bacterium]MBO6598015.1 hypothetical protein [Pseudomonadales bacterium]MBO6824530.1 hypothetical protein [Pseudomonadales bacterium]